MKNKEDAEKTERKILDKFDYAWNKGNNGKRRHADVRRKLDEVASNNIQFPKTIRNLLRFNHWPADIKIKASPEVTISCLKLLSLPNHSLGLFLIDTVLMRAIQVSVGFP